MSRSCDNCHKGIMRGNIVSHSKQRAKREYFPNLHKATIFINGVKKKMLLCTKCLRTLKKQATPKLKKVEEGRSK